MTEPSPRPTDALDVDALLARSEPRPGGRWTWGFTLGLLGLLLGGELLASQLPDLKSVIHAMTVTATLGLVTAAIVHGTITLRRHRAEQQAVAMLEEMVQLRRWEEATVLASQLLNRPMYQPGMRAQALLWLAMILARYGRYEQVLTVQEYLLSMVPLEPAAAHGVQLGRAMAMLHEDHLVDVDRAIGELRRGQGNHPSAGLALVEIYRDIKTGHPAEAIEIFESRRDLMRAQLGHRAADGWALVARAYDLLGRTDEAQRAYQNATLLGDASELRRRYPELSALDGRYSPTPLPAEVA